MQEEKYYKTIVNLIEEHEVNKRVRELKENNETLNLYWTIGKEIVEAQGGSVRAKYGDELIKKWGILLNEKYGSNYSKRNLMLYRQYYLNFKKVNALRSLLSWTHYKAILPIKNENERNYYINQVILNNLSTRELIQEIKNKSFDRLSYADKENIKLIEDNNYKLTIEDMIKDPIILKQDKKQEKLNEKALHKYIIEMLEDKFLELGAGFTLAGHEYKITIDNHTFKIDLLFFNYKLNCFVVVEVKLNKGRREDIEQVRFYSEIIDKQIKEKNNCCVLDLR